MVVQSSPASFLDWLSPVLEAQVTTYKFATSNFLPSTHPATTMPTPPSHVCNSFHPPPSLDTSHSISRLQHIQPAWQWCPRLQTAGHAGKSLLFPRRHLQVRQGLRTDMATPVPLRGSPPKLHLFFLKRKRIVPAIYRYLPTGRRL